MKHIVTLFGALLLFCATPLKAQNKIWSYGVGNWRNGPVVIITPVFETTEQFTTPQLIARIRKEYTELAGITDIDVQRFATPEEADDSRTGLVAKYGRRQLEVELLEAPVLEHQKPGNGMK
ncbi:MAG: hypothetical protein QM724_11315 [Flavobacteriales bacterium]